MAYKEHPTEKLYRIDLHTHTQEYSFCSHLPVEDLIIQAMAVGLDGVAVTDHSRIGGAEEAQSLGAKYGFAVFRGVEVHTTLGDILVFGLYRDFPREMDGGHLLRMVEEAGGASVAAHPFRAVGHALGRTLRRADIALESALDRCPELASLSAVEVLNGSDGDREASQARRLAQALALPGVGGSDAHFAPEVGSGATLFPDPISTDEELIAALRAGHCSPGRPQ
jgi:predicted metal-dependent phosphoesterase TrpH